MVPSAEGPECFGKWKGSFYLGMDFGIVGWDSRRNATLRHVYARDKFVCREDFATMKIYLS
jgi:hypothetical protein